MRTQSRRGDDTVGTHYIDELPESCIVNILAFISPRDACQISTLSSLFKSSAESNALWEKFLPVNYKSIIRESCEPSLMDRFPSKKDLFLHLSDHPILTDGSLKSFSLEKCSGKAIYMLSAKDLAIDWGDTPSYCKWVRDSQSRFNKVAQLVRACLLKIRGKINTSWLAMETLYGAYMVFRFTSGFHGLESCNLQVCVGITGHELSKKKLVFWRGGHHSGGESQRLLRPRRRPPRYGPYTSVGKFGNSFCVNRGDGWFEIELGEFLNCEGSEAEELEMEFSKLNGSWKKGIRVLGIEIRPKN